MPYGLTNMDMEKLQALFRLNKKIERVILYGSRAKGTFKPFSDVDITFIGENLTRSDLNQLAAYIDDLLLPYRFDLSLFVKKQRTGRAYRKTGNCYLRKKQGVKTLKFLERLPQKLFNLYVPVIFEAHAFRFQQLLLFRPRRDCPSLRIHYSPRR